MVADLAGGEFLLPDEFFNDDFIMEDNRTVAVEGELLRTGFASFIPSHSQSESAAETESVVEDHIAGLIRDMAYTFLYEDERVSSSSSKVPVMATYPQAALLHSGKCPESSRGSSKLPTKVSSSLFSSPVKRDCDLDFLYLEAGEVMRMRQIDDKFNRCRFPNPPKRPSFPGRIPFTRFMNATAIKHQQLQAVQFCKLKQQQLIKQQLAAAYIWQSRSAWSGRNKMNPTFASPALPSQFPGTGMKNVRLHIPGSRRLSAGTGVFLPRQADCPSEPFKNPEHTSSQGNPSFASQKWHQKQHHHHHTPVPSPPPAVTSHEILLPPEWTY